MYRYKCEMVLRVHCYFIEMQSFEVVADTMLTRSSMGGWAILTFSQSRLLSSFCPSLKIGFSFGFGVIFLGCNAIMDEVVAIEPIAVVVLVEGGGEGLMIGFGSTPKIFARRGSKVDSKDLF